MQNTSNIENAEINVSMNRQFSIFSLYNFTRNSVYFSCPKINIGKIESTKTRFYEKKILKNVKAFYIYATK